MAWGVESVSQFAAPISFYFTHKSGYYVFERSENLIGAYLPGGGESSTKAMFSKSWAKHERLDVRSQQVSEMSWRSR